MNAYSSPSVDAERLCILRLREERAALCLEREYLDSEGRVIALRRPREDWRRTENSIKESYYAF